jgi:Mrp family chromosome partitioning ATPase
LSVYRDLLNNVEKNDKSNNLTDKQTETAALSSFCKSSVQDDLKGLFFRLGNLKRTSGTRSILVTGLEIGSSISRVTHSLAGLMAEAPSANSNRSTVLILDGSGHEWGQDSDGPISQNPFISFLSKTGNEKPASIIQVMQGVDLLPFGSSSEAWLSYLDDEVLLSVISKMKDNYQWIIIDMPSASKPETLRWSTLADTVLFVLESGKVRRQKLNSLIDIYNNQGVNLLGTILNGRKYQIPNFIYKLMFK